MMPPTPHRAETWGDLADSHWPTIAEQIPHIVWMASPDGHWLGTATDIDSHKRSEEVLRDAGERLTEAQRLAQVERWLVARTEPVLGAAGDVVRVHGTAQDVTDRKRVEERLRLQADLLDSVGGAVIAADLTGNITYWGPEAARLYG